MGERDTITDIANIRSRSAAVAAEPGMIAIENIDGELQQVDDQGTSLPVGGTPGNYPLTDTYGVLDDSVAFNTQVTAVNARGGGVIQVPPGTHRFKNTGLLDGVTGITIDGLNRSSTRIMGDDSSGNIGDIIRIKNAPGCSVRNLNVTALSARTAGNGIRVIGGPATILSGGRNTVDGCDFTSQFVGVKIESDTVTPRQNFKVYVTDCDHWSLSSGGSGVWVDAATSYPTLTGASHFIERNWIYDASGLAAAGIRLTSTGDATLTGNEVLGPNVGLVMDPGAGKMLTSVTIIGGFYDGATTSCVQVIPNAAVGMFGAIRFHGVWFAAAHGGQCVNVLGSGARDVGFDGCYFYSAEGATDGWGAAVYAASGAKFDDCTFGGCRTGGLLFSSNASNFDVQNCKFWAGLGTGAYTGLPIAVQIDAGCDNYSIVNNDWADATVSAPKITNTPGASATRVVSPNR